LIVATDDDGEAKEEDNPDSVRESEAGSEGGEESCKESEGANRFERAAEEFEDAVVEKK